MYQRICLLLLLLQQAALELRSRQQPHDVCTSIDIQTVEDFAALRNCRIVVGYVRIANVDVTSAHNFSSPLEEITDYLLVYRTHGLETLQQVFPRLTLIRGRELLFAEYALAVYENRHLLNLGLVSLRRIQQGHVRIQGNPQLCYTHTVNWMQLLGNSTQQRFLLKYNKSPNYCPLCDARTKNIDEEDALDDSSSGDGDGADDSVENSNDKDAAATTAPAHVHQHCWYFGALQQPPSNGNSSKCAAAASAAACCGRNCIGVCEESGCKLCATLSQGAQCVEYCKPPYLEFNKRECITEQLCYQYGKLPHDGRCVQKCPAYYQQILDTRGHLRCTLNCNGPYLIRNTRDLSGLQDCSKIIGSLTIALSEMQTHIVSELERVFSTITEITGYLKVKHSPQLVSLGFLSNLHTIGGTELINSKYALFIVDNHHLEHIWAPNQKVVVRRGRVFFHLNPRLCYDKISAIQSSLRGPDISIIEASPNSNGERVLCGDAVRVLNATVEDFNATAARIKVNPMSADDKVVLLGYVHHYKEAPSRNVSMYDGRHGCGHDHWRMDIAPSQNVRHIISNLKPYTQYAFFVKTMTMTEYHLQIVAYSEIKYFTTLPSKPSAVAKIFYHSMSSSEIELHWWPPHNPNGAIAKYIIYYEQVKPPIENETLVSGYRTKPTGLFGKCECAMLQTELSGPSPEDENYYDKEQVTYDESLSNQVYVSRRIITKLPKNDTQSKSAGNQTAARKENADADGSRSSNATNIRVHRMAVGPKEPSSNDIYLTVPKEVDDGEKNLRSFRDEYEMTALAEQDNGPAGFPILKPAPICAYNSTVVQQSCETRELFKGFELPGHQHTYTLTKLKPEAAYRITVRACVVGLVNGCGRETAIVAETVSKSVERFLKRWQELY